MKMNRHANHVLNLSTVQVPDIGQNSLLSGPLSSTFSSAGEAPLSSSNSINCSDLSPSMNSKDFGHQAVTNVNSNNNCNNGGYYGFRTRHLSCIEETESDSYNSLPSDFIQEPVEALAAFHVGGNDDDDVSQWENENDDLELDYGFGDLHESYNSVVCNGADGNSSILSEAFYTVHQTENPENLELNPMAMTTSVVQPSSSITYNEFECGLMKKYPEIMTNSCYGSLNYPQTFTSEAAGGGSCSNRKNSMEPIYAVIDKEIRQKNARKKTRNQLDENASDRQNVEMKVGRQHQMGSDGWFDDTVSEAIFGEQNFDLHPVFDEVHLTTCSNCNMPFDNDKRRKLIDSCGHERCYSCMFANEKCPFCFIKDDATAMIQSYNEKLTKSTPSKHDMIRSCDSSLYSTPEKHKSISPINTPERTPLTTTLNNTELTGSSNSSKEQQTQTNQSRKKKGFRRPFGYHRRTSSQGSLEVQSSLSDCSVLESSFHSDSVITKSKKSLNFGPSKSNGINFSGSTYAGHLSSIVFGKIKSLWNAQSNNAGLNQLAVSTEQIDSKEPQENIYSKIVEPVEAVMREKKPIEGIAASHRLSANLRTIRDWTLRKTPKPNKVAKNDKHPPTQHRVQSPQSALQYLALKPLFFEVPLQEPDPLFIGRQWILRDMSNTLTTSEMPGIVIVGNAGSGKTALILQLVDHSCFGRKKTAPTAVQMETDGIYCQINVSHDRIKSIASQVVAYHFCQVENNRTCLVPDFVHSLAAQLCQAPQLTAYREHLLNETQLQDLLTIKECIANPERVMRLGILEPLSALKAAGKITIKQCFLLVDALCEAEVYQSDYGFTISSFLAAMANSFPAWFKVITTVRTQMLDSVKGLPYMKLTLDNWECNENVQKDMAEYVAQRVNHSPDLQKNVDFGRESNASQKVFNYLMCLAKGSFLYAKLALDLIERGELAVSSSSYKSLPVSLSQIFLLNFSKRFPTTSDYERVTDILSVCLAAPSPLTLSEIYYSVVALDSESSLEWSEFAERFKLLESFLIKRIDNTYMFFHPSFREWLMRRDNGEVSKFLIDYRRGHAAIAFRLSRLQAPLDVEQTLELAYHIVKSNLYRSLQSTKKPLRDVQSYWIAAVSNSVTNAFVSLRNIFQPNEKVWKILLLAGAKINAETELLAGSTVLAVASHHGMNSTVSTLLEFGADVEKANWEGCTPLMMAARQGHIEIVRLLVSAGSRLGRCCNLQQCALVYAAKIGKANVIKYLLTCNWKHPKSDPKDISFAEALQQSLVAAVFQKFVDIVEDLLDLPEISLDSVDPLTGDTALTAASKTGHSETAAILLSRGAEIDRRNRENNSPLLLAVIAGHCNIVELLLKRGSHVDQIEDATDKTSLIIAAKVGHVNIVKLLLRKNASIEKQDSNGLTALSWACLQGHLQIVKCLLDFGASIETSDSFDRTPLDFASYQGSLRLVQLLLGKGAVLQHADRNGVTPLDRAIASRNIPVLQAYLKLGAIVGPTTWALAEDSSEIILLLINGLVREGNGLLKNQTFTDAIQRFEFALQKIATIDSTVSNRELAAQLHVNLLLNLARCKRKMKNLPESIDLAARAIVIAPTRYEGYYVRAKALLENGNSPNALKDINTALEKAQNTTLYIKEILQKIKTDILARSLASGMVTTVVSDRETTDL